MTSNLPRAPQLVMPEKEFFAALQRHFECLGSIDVARIVASVESVYYGGATRFRAMAPIEIEGVRIIAQRRNLTLPI